MYQSCCGPFVVQKCVLQISLIFWDFPQFSSLHQKISISFHSIILIIPKRNKHFKKWSIHEKSSCITDGLCITRVVIVPYINKTGGNHRWPKPVLFRLSPTRNPIQERTSPFFTSYYNDTTYRNAFHSARIIPHCKYWYLQRRPNQQSRYGIIS